MSDKIAISVYVFEMCIVSTLGICGVFVALQSPNTILKIVFSGLVLGAVTPVILMLKLGLESEIHG